MTSRYALACYGLAGAAALLLAACSSGGTPATTSPKATAAATSAPTATASPTPSLSGVLSVSITGLPADPSLSFGGAPVQFTVTLTNGTSSTYQNIGVVVSMAHCTCSHFPVGQAPQGTMKLQSAATGQWQSIFYDVEGGGMDYVDQTLGSITLSPGAAQSYKLQVAFDSLSQQGSGWFSGKTAIDATVVALPAHTIIGRSPAASVPLGVVTS